MTSQLYRNKGFVTGIKPYSIVGAGSEVCKGWLALYTTLEFVTTS